ncbi:MAG TPA: sulfur carrier protein ThiS [Nitrospirae bacterium]|nr:sulfur carrier protein ThiS [Nitrospirota bacterium]
MRIRLNGEEYITGDVKSVEDLLKELKIHSERVAVEVNLKIISKSDYRIFILKDGDTVEVVSFVGGGGYGRQVYYTGNRV